MCPYDYHNKFLAPDGAGQFLWYSAELRAEWSVVRVPAEAGEFFSSLPRLEPIQLPIQWVRGILSLYVKRPEREADNSPPSSAEFKNSCSYNSTPTLRHHGVMIS
jgi:hypothetical protein